MMSPLSSRLSRRSRVLGIERPLLRRLALGLLLTVVGAVVGALYGVVRAPAYTASAYLVVVAQEGSSQEREVSFAQAFGRISDNGDLLTPAASALNTSVGTLARLVNASTSPDAPLIKYTGTTPDAGYSARAANAVADAMIAYANARTPDTGVRVATFSSATPPESPSSASASLTTLMGAAVGFLVAGLSVFAGSVRTSSAPTAPVVPAAPVEPPAPVAPPAPLVPSARAPETPSRREAADEAPRALPPDARGRPRPDTVRPVAVAADVDDAQTTRVRHVRPVTPRPQAPAPRSWRASGHDGTSSTVLPEWQPPVPSARPAPEAHRRVASTNGSPVSRHGRHGQP